MNVAEKDRQLFDSIAEDYCKKDRVEYARAMRKLRLTRSLKNVKKPIHSILELGCGAGFAAEYLKGHYQEFVGVDYSQNLINYANQLHAADNVSFSCSDIFTFNPGEKKFDVIFMIGVLHHIPNPDAALVKCKEWLAPGGVLIANEPARGNPIIWVARKIRKKIDSNYSEDQVEFSRSELIAMYEKAGFKTNSFPQGFLSTILAETQLLPDSVGEVFASLFGAIDPIVEDLWPQFAPQLAWNVVVEGTA